MAQEKNSEKKVETLLIPILEENNFDLADIEFVKEGPNWYLRIFIDKTGGVSIDDCEIVSRALETVLDEKDPIGQPYILEVSSPGIDRPLKKESDFVKYAGQIVDVKLYKPFEGSKEFQGQLIGLNEGVVTITNDEGKDYSFTRKDIAGIRLAVMF